MPFCAHEQRGLTVYLITFVFYKCGMTGPVRDSWLPVVLKEECCIINHCSLNYSNTRHCISRVRIAPCLFLFLEVKSCSKLGVFHPVVCTCKRILYLTVVRQQCGAMFLSCNYQLNDMFRPYRAIISLYKIMVIRQGTCGSTLLCNDGQIKNTFKMFW